MSIIKKYVWLVVGTLMVAISFNLFFVPNDLAATGVSGLAIILSSFFNISPLYFIYVVNIILIGVSFVFLGWEDTRGTILGSILVPIFMSLTSNISLVIDLRDVDILIKAVIGGLVSGYGCGIIFKNGFTTGGTDIIESIISKYFKIPLSKAMIMVDGMIVCLCGFVFGVEHMIYALIILVLISLCSNRFMFGINDDKILFITSKKYDEIRRYIISRYHYGVTIMDGEGGYSKVHEKILMCSIKASFYVEIMQAIKVIDSEAFVSVVNSYETGYLDKERRKKLRKY